MSDWLVSLTPTDSLGNLQDKLVAGLNVDLNLIGTPGDQQMEISFQCCDTTDEMVAAWPGETPGYLETVLIAEPGSDVTVTRDGDQIKIGLTTSIEDKKVAVDAWEDWDYLENVLQAGEGIELTNDGSNHLIIQLKSPTDATNVFTRPYAKIVLDTTVSIPAQSNLVDMIYIFGNYGPWVTGTFVNTDYAGSWTWLKDSFENSSAPGMINTTDGTITITKTWPYRIFLQGNVEVNRWVAAIRAMMLIRRGSSNTIALSSRFGGVIGQNGDNLHVPPAGWTGCALWGRLQRLTICDSDIVQLEENDVLFFCTRVSTSVTDAGNASSVHFENRSNSDIDGEFFIYGNDSVDMWFSFGCDYIGNVQ